MNKYIICFFIASFILSSNIAFSAEDSTFIYKQQEFEQLKIEVERLKAKKVELEIENKRLSNLLNSNLNSENPKIKAQLEVKLSKLTDDNSQKEKIIEQKQDELSKAKKEKAEKEIKKAEKKKDLEFRKKEVEKAEMLLKTINEENTKLINDCEKKLKSINDIEDKHDLSRTNFPSDFLNDYSQNNNYKSNSEKQGIFSLIDKDINKNNNVNNSNRIIIQDFTYSSGFNYCDFKLKANNLNDSIKMSIYKGNIVKLFDYSDFHYNKDKNYYELNWDLKDLVGNSVGKGIYVARIEVNGKEVKKINFELKY